jgi:hypothetical protein
MKKRPKKSTNSRALQEGLKLMRSCPLCKHEFGEESVRVLEQREESHLVHVTCPKCLSAVLAVILVSPLGMSSVGVFTDLDAADVMKIRHKRIFSEDDVLDFYKFVERHSVTKEFIKM